MMSIIHVSVFFSITIVAAFGVTAVAVLHALITTFWKYDFWKYE